MTPDPDPGGDDGMTWKVGGLTLAALVALLAAAPAAPAEQIACGKRSDLLQHFQQAYHEGPSVIGLTHDGRLLEVVVAPSGTWTMLVTAPGGPACVVATGQDWQAITVETDPAA
jgi:hypothetical protein